MANIIRSWIATRLTKSDVGKRIKTQHYAQVLFPRDSEPVSLVAKDYATPGTLVCEINDKEYMVAALLEKEAVDHFKSENGETIPVKRELRGGIVQLQDYEICLHVADTPGESFFFFRVNRFNKVTNADSSQFADVRDPQMDKDVKNRLRQFWSEKRTGRQVTVGADNAAQGGSQALAEEGTQLLLNLAQSEPDGHTAASVCPHPLAVSFLIHPDDKAVLERSADDPSMCPSFEAYRQEDAGSCDSFAASLGEDDWRPAAIAAQQQTARLASSRRAQVTSLLTTTSKSRPITATEPIAVDSCSLPRRPLMKADVVDPCLLSQATVDLDVSSSTASTKGSQPMQISQPVLQTCSSESDGADGSDYVTAGESPDRQSLRSTQPSLEAVKQVFGTPSPSALPLLCHTRSAPPPVKPSDTSLQALEALAREDVCLDETLVRRNICSLSPPPLNDSVAARQDVGLDDSKVRRNLFSSGSTSCSGVHSQQTQVQTRGSSTSQPPSPVLFSSSGERQKEKEQFPDTWLSSQANPFKLPVTLQERESAEPEWEETQNPFSTRGMSPDRAAVLNRRRPLLATSTSVEQIDGKAVTGELSSPMKTSRNNENKAVCDGALDRPASSKILGSSNESVSSPEKRQCGLMSAIGLVTVSSLGFSQEIEARHHPAPTGHTERTKRRFAVETSSEDEDDITIHRPERGKTGARITWKQSDLSMCSDEEDNIAVRCPERDKTAARRTWKQSTLCFGSSRRVATATDNQNESVVFGSSRSGREVEQPVNVRNEANDDMHERHSITSAATARTRHSPASDDRSSFVFTSRRNAAEKRRRQRQRWRDVVLTEAYRDSRTPPAKPGLEPTPLEEILIERIRWRRHFKRRWGIEDDNDGSSESQPSLPPRIWQHHSRDSPPSKKPR